MEDLTSKTSTISTAKLEANRTNAQSSTGPRSEEGKARSAMNARTHGLCSADLLLPGEDPQELAQLHQEYLDQFEPATPIERSLFDEILASSWKLRRIQRAETALCSKAESFQAVFEDDQLQKKLDNLARHRTRIERTFYRAIQEMKAQQTNRAILQQAVGMAGTFPIQADARQFAKRSQAAARPRPPQPAPPADLPQDEAELESAFAGLDELFLPKEWKKDPEAA